MRKIILAALLLYGLNTFSYDGPEMSFPTPKDRTENIGMFGSEVMLTWDSSFKKDPGAVFIKKITNPTPIVNYKKFINQIIQKSKSNIPFGIQKEYVLFTKHKQKIICQEFKTGEGNTLRSVFVALIPKNNNEYYMFYYKDLALYYDAGVKGLKLSLFHFKLLD